MKKLALLMWTVVIIAMTLLAGCGADGGGTSVSVSDVGNVEGTVTDATSGTVVSGATVQVGEKSATTNSSGVYSVTDLAVGSRTITATKTNYQNYTGIVTVTKGTTVTQNIQMTLTGASDSTPPTVLSTNPANNATGVAINQAITVTFSEAMDCSTITTSSFTLKDNLNAAAGGTISSCNNTIAVFTPSSNLSYNTLYTAVVSTGVKDVAGNAMASDYTWSFTTGIVPDTTPPTVTSTSPANNATGIAVNSTITAIFSENMDSSTTPPLTLKQGTTAISGTATYSGTTTTFTPSSSLSYSTTYTATINSGAKDAAGNSMASDYTWSFTTAAGSSAPHLMGGAIQGVPLNLTNTVTTFAGSTGVSGSADGTGVAATFYFPNAITTDGTNIYVADTLNYTIRKIVISTGDVTTIAGSAGQSGSTDGTGLTARFNWPEGITTDGTNLYLADTGNNVIRQIAISTGAVTTIAGSAGLSGSTDGSGSATRFSFPHDITTDGTNLYIAESGNHTIRKIVISTGVVTTLAGSAGQSGSTDGTGSAARFYDPSGITTDGTNLYVSDNSNCTIRKVIISTGVVTTLAGSPGQLGSSDGTGSEALFNGKLEKITTDGTNLYLADGGNGTIRKIEISTGAVTTIAGTPGIYVPADGVGSAATFNGPMGMTTDGTNLFVTDFWYNIIRKIQ